MSGFRFDHTAEQGARDDDDPILPLINVVFLLLIFFMIVGSVAQVDPFDIEPPASDAPQGAGEDAVTMHVSVDGRLSVNGQIVELAQLAEVLGSRAGSSAGPMRIKADARVDATRLVAVLEGLREAGIESVRLLTVQRDS